MSDTNFWTKLWEGIKNFFKKFWYVILVPIGLFFAHLLFKDSNSELKKEIKKEEKEIKKETKEIKKQEAATDKKEEEVKQQIADVQETTEKQKESQEQRKAEIEEILPGLKK